MNLLQHHGGETTRWLGEFKQNHQQVAAISSPPPHCVYMCLQVSMLVACSQNWSISSFFSRAFSLGPDLCLLGCPGFISQNRKQLQFVTSAACFTVLCLTQTTEDDVVTQPELRLDNACSREERGIFIFFFMLRGQKEICLLTRCPQSSWNIHSSFILLMRQISGFSMGPKPGQREDEGGFIDSCLLLVVSSPWKLEQQSIEIW